MRRREFIAALSASAFAQAPFSPAALIGEYEKQGDHRTGTPVDIASGLWLMKQVEAAGLKPTRENWSFSQIVPKPSYLELDGRRIDGLPLFDGTFTSGITGVLGEDIGVFEAAPNTAGAGDVGQARREGNFKAIVLVTKGGRPGLCPNNADDFPEPFGPPVLQVAERPPAGARVRLVADAKRVPGSTFNVTARIAGKNRTLPPLVVMTPRSGWWTCAGERGGGLYCWLAVMRGFRNAQPERDVIFVASSGHEIGYRGIEEFIKAHDGIVKNSHAWIHFGANIGARPAAVTVQASDDAMEDIETAALTKAGFEITRRVKRGTIPAGEAGSIHRRNGRYCSLLGQNDLFHNQLDRGPEAIDPERISRFGEVFSGVARRLAGNS